MIQNSLFCSIIVFFFLLTYRTKKLVQWPPIFKHVFYMFFYNEHFRKIIKKFWVFIAPYLLKEGAYYVIPLCTIWIRRKRMKKKKKNENKLYFMIPWLSHDEVVTVKRLAKLIWYREKLKIQQFVLTDKEGLKLCCDWFHRRNQKPCQTTSWSLLWKQLTI